MSQASNGLHRSLVTPAAPPPREQATHSAVHRRKIEQIAQDAQSLAGAAQLIADRFAQVLAHGGAVNIQPQMNFITGALARMQKDWGVAEHLQAQGCAVKRSAVGRRDG